MSKPFLCVNMNYIGDAIMTTPAVERLARVSGLPVDVIASPPALESLKGNPSVGELIARTSTSATGRCAQLMSVIRQGRYDEVVILPSIPIYRTAAKMAGARRVFMVPKLTGDMHMAEHLVRAVEAHYGLTPGPVELTLTVTDDDRSWLRYFLNLDPSWTGPLVALNIGASRPQKRWPIEQFAECAQLLSNNGCRIVILGGQEDSNSSYKIHMRMAGSASHYYDLVGTTSIRQMIGVIEQCDVVITADTAALHIASALKTPLVALFGSTDPAQTGPIGNGKRIVLYDKLPCSPCRSRPTCGGAFTCMSSISPKLVADSALSLLPVPTEIGAR